MFIIYGWYYERVHHQKKNGTMACHMSKFANNNGYYNAIWHSFFLSLFFAFQYFLVQVPSLLLCQNLTNIMSKVFPNPNSLHQNNIEIIQKGIKNENYHDNLPKYCLSLQAKELQIKWKGESESFDWQKELFVYIEKMAWNLPCFSNVTLTHILASFLGFIFIIIFF